MNVFLVRHGIPVDLGHQGISRDEDRHLSHSGEVILTAAAAGLAAAGCRPDRIITSPLIRARQTAEIIRMAVNPSIILEEQAFLKWETPPDAAMDWLEVQPRESILLVGHMPHLALLASRMLAGVQALNFQISPATALCIQFEREVLPGLGRLVWMMGAEELGRLK